MLACKTAVTIRKAFLLTYKLCALSEASWTTFRLSSVFTEKRSSRIIFQPHLLHDQGGCSNKCLISRYFCFHHDVFIVIMAVPGT